MTLCKIQVNICPGCGFDVARPSPALPSGFEVWCPPDLGGCNSIGAHGDTELEAIKLWNAGLMFRRGVAYAF